MSSTKTCVRVQRLNSASQNNGHWSAHSATGIAPRLLKAKSSPNVSKSTTATPTPTPAQRQTIRLDSQSPASFLHRKTSVTCSKLPPSGQKSSPRQNNVTIVEILPMPVPANRSSPTAAKNPQKLIKKTTDSSIMKINKDGSCTILEDRALLKKGLSTTPDNKLPKKSEALRKKCLNRSTSLWNVATTADHQVNKRVSRPSLSMIDTKKDEIKNRTLNRATSLWNVPMDNSVKMSRAKSVNGLLKPSRIPLFTQHFGGGSNVNLTGQSLGNLSLVDPSTETTRYTAAAAAAATRIIDFDEIDNATTSVYQNSHQSKISTIPIYENLKDSKKELLVRTVSVPVIVDCHQQQQQQQQHVSYLEKRAEELMAELNNDAEEKIIVQRSPSKWNSRLDLAACRASLEKSRNLLSQSRDNLDKSKEELARSKEELAKSKDNINKSQDFLDRTRTFAKSHDNLISTKRDFDINNIQEIRKNWENQIKRSQNLNEIDNNSKKKTIKSTICNKLNEKKKLSPSTKDIVQLVNFFNCKNENVKEPPSAITSIDDGPVKMKKKQKKNEKINGYSSDGNCSEDSGHMSNENDVEWKEELQLPPVALDNLSIKNHKKTEKFLNEIIHDLDINLERAIEVFDAPAAACNKVSSRSMSSSASSSIDSSWDDQADAKTTKQNVNGNSSSAGGSDQVKIPDYTVFFIYYYYYYYTCIVVLWK